MAQKLADFIEQFNATASDLGAVVEEIADIEKKNVECVKRIAELEADKETLRQNVLELQDSWGREQMKTLTLEFELYGLRRSWWSAFRNEMKQPEYAEFITAKNEKGLFDYLKNENVEFDLDPIPASIVRGAISDLLIELKLNPEIVAEKKPVWREILLEQLQALGDNAKEVPAVFVRGLVARAIGEGVLPPTTKIGVVLTSRLKLLGFADRIKSPIDIIEAMGWGPEPENPAPTPTPEPTP